MTDPEMIARLVADSAFAAAEAQPQLRTVKVSDVQYEASASAVEVTAPNRDAAMSEVGPLVGIGSAEVTGTPNVLILDGDMPLRIGKSPWTTS